MSLKVEWLVEGQVCVVTAPEVIDGEMLKNHDSLMMRWLDAGREKVYVIVDVSAMKRVESLKHAFMLKHIRHPRMTHTFTVGLTLNPTARFIIPIVAQAIGIHYKDFARREDARAYITEISGI